MKNTIIIIAGLILLPANTYAEKKSNFDSIDLKKAIKIAQSNDNIGGPVFATKNIVKEHSKKEEPADWLIMVYMNGRSNIEPFALNDMNRFESVGSSDKVKIVVELGRSKGLDNDTDEDGDWTGSRRYLVVKDSDMKKIKSPVLLDLGDRDMGDWRQAADFSIWARENFPAKKTMLIIWDHGWGWINPKKSNASLISKSISHDFATGNYIKTSELSKIFAKAGKVDLYASMACFMQMAEVSYQIKDYAKVIVGSEEVVQLPSFNFEDFYRMMIARPDAGAKQSGIFLVDTFKEMYSRPEHSDMLKETKYGVQLSAINASMMKDFGKKLSAWAETAIKVNDRNAMSQAKKDVIRFEVGDEITDPKKEISFYGDIYDFIRIVNENLNPDIPGAKTLKSKGVKLQRFIENKLVIKNVSLGKDRTGKDFSNTRGIAAHIPGKPGILIEYDNDYKELDFAKATLWEDFINYLKKID